MGAATLEVMCTWLGGGGSGADVGQQAVEREGTEAHIPRGPCRLLLLSRSSSRSLSSSRLVLDVLVLVSRGCCRGLLAVCGLLVSSNGGSSEGSLGIGADLA